MIIKHLMAPMLSLVAVAAFAQSPATSPATGEPAQAKAPASKAHILSNAEFDKLLAHPEKILLIDVRRPDEVTAIGGFPVYLSVQIAELERSTAWIPKERSIVVISNHAGRGGKGADILAARGFKVIGAIGAQTYEHDGGTLTKIEPKSATPAVASTVDSK